MMNVNYALLGSSTYHESIGSDNIKHCDSQQSLWIEGARFLENLGRNWHCRVDRITDQVDNGLRAALSNSFTKGFNNPGVDVE